MANNITELLYRIKDNIKAVEADNNNQVILDVIRSDFLEMVELMKLFLISERDSYYGFFMMNLSFEADFFSRSIAGIKLNTFPPVFSSNPLLLCKLSLKEILYVFCHEIDHIVLNHPAEMVKANPSKDERTYRLFNIAADAAVNDRINFEIQNTDKKFLSQPEGIITSDVLGSMFGLHHVYPLENYAYYYDLIKDKDTDESQPKRIVFDLINEDRDTESAHDGEVVTVFNCGTVVDHNWYTESDPEDAEANVREIVNAAMSMMNEETRGMMPGFFISQIEELNKPPIISWQNLLKKYIGTIAANKVKTRSRLNRRQPQRFDLSGSMAEKVLKIVVAIDTSASVSDDEIAGIFNEIFAILAKRKHDITIIECDSEVQRVYKAKTQADIQKKVAGRGGTWFTPVIEYINNDRYFRDALLIYFTDGYGEDKIPKPMTYRNLWVVLEKAEHLSLYEPYGVVVAL